MNGHAEPGKNATSDVEVSEQEMQELREKIQAAMASGAGENIEAAPQSWWARYGFYLVLAVAVMKLAWYAIRG